ncbi:MAG: tetratricopeptide repeat protein [Planctomycetes bacterium]|nr:tetratricopeptide repeat protein [Planctomycetota bacterium]
MRFFISVPAVVIMAAVAARAEGHDAYNAGVEATRRHQYSKALGLYEEAMKDKAFAAEHPDVYYWAGQAAVLAGERRGEEYLVRALGLCGDLDLRGRARYWLAEARLMRGSPGGALKALDEGAVAEIYMRRAGLVRLKASVRAGKPKETLSVMKGVVEYRELDAETAGAIGPAVDLLKKSLSGDDLFELLKELAKRAGPVTRAELARRGAYEAARGNNSGQALYFLKTLDGEGQGPEAIVSALEDLKAGRAAEAEKRLGDLLAVADCSPEAAKVACRVLTGIYMDTGRFGDVLGLAKRFPAVGGDAELMLCTAEFACAAGRWEAVLEALGYCTPDNLSEGQAERYHYAGGWARYRLGTPGEAAPEFLRMVRRCSASARAPEALYLAAVCLYDAGNLQKAEEAMEMVRRLYPESAFAACGLERSEPATVNVKDLPGDETGETGGQEQDGAGDI